MKKLFYLLSLLFLIQQLTIVNNQLFAQLIINLSSTPSSCGQPNGSATASVTGGSGTYTYLWNTPPPQTTATASNLPAGTYTVTVNDAGGGFSGIDSIIVNVTPQVYSSIVHTDVLCYGICDGTATVTASGGTPPISYTWSDNQTTPTATGLCAGIYYVTVTDDVGCNSISNVTILQPAQPLQSSIVVTNVYCYGQATGAVDLTVIGGTGWPNFSYFWSPGGYTQEDLSGVPAGTYTVTITDANGCTLVDTAVITQPATPVSVNVTTQNLTCYGVCEGLAVAIPDGGTPSMGGYTFNWDTLGCVNDSLIDVCAGTYTVTVTDGAGCTASGSAIITQPSQPAPLFLVPVDVLCYGDSTGEVMLNYADIQPTDSYFWSNLDTTQDIYHLPAGWYQVTVTTIDSCVRIANITVTQPTALNISLLPIDENCLYSCDGSIQSTVSGGTPGYYGYTYLWSDGQTTDDATFLCNGTYIATVTDSLGCQTEDMVTVGTDNMIAASFNASAVTGNIPLNVNFTYTGTSSSANSYNWDFGDGTNSTLEDPSHTYTVANTFKVQLVLNNNLCSDTFYIYINAGSTDCYAQFGIYPDTLIPHHYFVVNMAAGVQPISYLWSWGDGTSDTIPYPSHTYNTAGYYNICLTITDNIGCNSTYCDSSYIQKSTNTIISVDVIPPSVGIIESIVSNFLNIFPNPATNNLQIITDFQIYKIEITDITGRLHYTTTSKTIDCSGFAKGVYFMKVKTDAGIAVKKFIKD